MFLNYKLLTKLLIKHLKVVFEHKGALDFKIFNKHWNVYKNYTVRKTSRILKMGPYN